MTINIYWSDLGSNYFMDPYPVLSYLKNRKVLKTDDLNKCPSFISYYKNTYAIKAGIDYSIEWDGKSLHSDRYGQWFFDRYILPRNADDGLISLAYPPVIFIADKSMVLEQLNPSLSNSNFSNNTKIIQGAYNCHKHIRPLETPFMFNEKGKVNINENDDLYYVRFLTDEKIKFHRFVWDKSIYNLIPDYQFNKAHTSKVKSLEWWYNINNKLRTTNKIIKYIKKMDLLQ